MVIRYCIPSFEPVQELPTIKTLEDARQTCPLCFAQHQLSSAKLTNIRVSLGEKRAQWNLWFWRMGRLLKPWLLNTWKAGKCSAQDGSPLRVLAASVPQKLSWFDAPRAHQKTHPQLWRHPAAPLTCFKRRTSQACKILQNIKTLKTSRDCSMAVAAMELQQATLWYLVGCFLSFDTGRSESHPSLSLLGFPHCQRCFQEVIPKSSLWWFPPCER